MCTVVRLEKDLVVTLPERKSGIFPLSPLQSLNLHYIYTHVYTFAQTKKLSSLMDLQNPFHIEIVQ